MFNFTHRKPHPLIGRGNPKFEGMENDILGKDQRAEFWRQNELVRKRLNSQTNYENRDFMTERKKDKDEKKVYWKSFENALRQQGYDPASGQNYLDFVKETEKTKGIFPFPDPKNPLLWNWKRTKDMPLSLADFGVAGKMLDALGLGDLTNGLLGIYNSTSKLASKDRSLSDVVDLGKSTFETVKGGIDAYKGGVKGAVKSAAKYGAMEAKDAIGLGINKHYNGWKKRKNDNDFFFERKSTISGKGIKGGMVKPSKAIVPSNNNVIKKGVAKDKDLVQADNLFDDDSNDSNDSDDLEALEDELKKLQEEGSKKKEVEEKEQEKFDKRTDEITNNINSIVIENPNKSGIAGYAFEKSLFEYMKNKLTHKNLKVCLIMNPEFNKINYLSKEYYTSLTSEYSPTDAMIYNGKTGEINFFELKNWDSASLMLEIKFVGDKAVKAIYSRNFPNQVSVEVDYVLIQKTKIEGYEGKEDNQKFRPLYKRLSKKKLKITRVIKSLYKMKKGKEYVIQVLDELFVIKTDNKCINPDKIKNSKLIIKGKNSTYYICNLLSLGELFENNENFKFDNDEYSLKTKEEYLFKLPKIDDYEDDKDYKKKLAEYEALEKIVNHATEKWIKVPIQYFRKFKDLSKEI